MIEIGISAGKEIVEEIARRDPSEVCGAYVFDLPPQLFGRSVQGTILSESPLAHMIVSTGSKCIVALSPTLWVSELSNISVFLERRFGIFRAYLTRDKEVLFKAPRLEDKGCLAFLSDPNFPTGKALTSSEMDLIAESFDAVIVDATYSFLSRGSEGKLMRKEHMENLIAPGGRKAFIFLRLHDIFTAPRYPAFLVIAGSSRLMETFLMVAGWKRNGIACAYSEVTKKEMAETMLKQHAGEMLSITESLKNQLIDEGFEVYDSDTPYFLATEVPSRAIKYDFGAVSLESFEGIDPRLKLLYPRTSKVLR